MKLLTMKMQVEEWERWKRQAEAECLSLAAWIRERCNGKAEVRGVQRDVHRAEKPGNHAVVPSTAEVAGAVREGIAEGAGAEHSGVGDEAGGTEEAVGVGGPVDEGRGGTAPRGFSRHGETRDAVDSRKRFSTKSKSRKSEKKSGECGYPVAPGIYCPKCKKVHE